jgi:hypothetical protein
MQCMGKCHIRESCAYPYTVNIYSTAKGNRVCPCVYHCHKSLGVNKEVETQANFPGQRKLNLCWQHEGKLQVKVHVLMNTRAHTHMHTQMYAHCLPGGNHAVWLLATAQYLYKFSSFQMDIQNMQTVCVQ